MADHASRIAELLTRGVAEIIDRKALEQALLAGKPLRVKFGIDPTSPDIHLGRSVPLLKLRAFQELGHRIVLIVGNFTGQIGDTSDKESERPMLSEEQVRFNMQNYLEQAGLILDMDKVEVKFNAEWLGEMKLAQLGKLADHFSVAEFIGRENIKKRLDAGKRVSLREMLYPLMQGYDSVAVESDVELGGTDQKFNLLAGRTLQKALGQKPQDVLMTNLILGTDGRKMSSSWGNTITLRDEPNAMFGKVMSIPDEQIDDYFVHCTRVPSPVIQSLDRANHPRDAKLRLAQEIVTLYHGEEAGESAKRYFVETISEKKIPDEVRSFPVSTGATFAQYIFEAGLAASKSDARRKIEQGGVELDGEKLEPGAWSRPVAMDYAGGVLKVGKKDFVKIAFE